MQLKSVCLAGAALLAIAVPAAASADPYWAHDGWRGHEWREHVAWEHAYGRAWYGGPRCVVEERGHYDWYGRWVHQPVRVCYR